MPPAPAKLKLLCLHGYMQNAEVFRSRVGSLRKALKSRVDFVFVDAPFEAQGLPGDDPEEVQGGAGGRSWWQWTDTGPDGRPSKAANYTGWEVAQAALVSALREHQPDGLLGFSQGATATALLLAHLAARGPEGAEAPLPRLRFAIMVAGFLPRDPSVAALLTGEGAGPEAGGAKSGAGGSGGGGGQLNEVPLLFVSGTADALVPPDRTSALWRCFPASTVSSFTHGGAHLVPTCSGEFKATLTAFLDAAAAGGPIAPVHRVASSGALAAGKDSAGAPAESGPAAKPSAVTEAQQPAANDGKHTAEQAVHNVAAQLETLRLTA